MKLISASLLVVLFAATAHGLGALFKPLPSPRYGPPGILANLTSKLFNPNQTTGTSQLFNLINTITSGLYAPIANGINQAFLNKTGIGNILNYLSANIFGGGFCAFPPATTLGPMLPGQTTTQGPSAAAPSNPLQGFLDMIQGGGNSGASSSNTDMTTLIQQIKDALASGGGTPGSSGGMPTNPNLPQVALSDLANRLNCSQSDLAAALTANNLTTSQLASALNDTATTDDQFHAMIAQHFGNIAATIADLLNQLASKASSDVQSLAKALNVTVPSFCISALQSNIPLSTLNSILSKLGLSVPACVAIYTTTCNRNFPCLFQQLLNLLTNLLTGNGGGLGNTVTNNLNDLTQALGPLGGVVNNLVGGLLTSVNGLLGGLLKNLG